MVADTIRAHVNTWRKDAMKKGMFLLILCNAVIQNNLFTNNSFSCAARFFFSRRDSTEEKLLEKEEKKMKHEKDATEKAENFQLALGAQNMKNKSKRGGVQQKLLSKLSYQDMYSSPIAHFYLFFIMSTF